MNTLYIRPILSFILLNFILLTLISCSPRPQAENKNKPKILKTQTPIPQDNRVIRPPLTKERLLPSPPTQTGTLADFGFDNIFFMAVQPKGMVPQNFDTVADEPDHYTISADGRWLAFANGSVYNEAVHIWDLKTLKQKYSLVDKSFKANSLGFRTYSHFYPTKPWLITHKGSGKNKALCPKCDAVTTVWNIKTGKRLLSITSEQWEKPYTITDDGRLYRIENKNIIENWDIEKGQLLRTLNLQPIKNKTINVTTDFITSNSQDLLITKSIHSKNKYSGLYRDTHHLNITNLKTGKIQHSISFGNTRWRAVFVGKDQFVVATEYGELSLWNARTGKKIEILIPSPNKSKLHMAHDGNWLVYNGKGLLAVGTLQIRGIQIWDMQKRKKIARLNTCEALGKGKRKNVVETGYPVAFKDNTLVTISGCITSVQVWDVEKKKLRGVIKSGHKGNWFSFQLPDKLTTSLHKKK